MATNHFIKYYGLILRVFIGLTILFWGYEKLVVEKLTQAYTLDYGKFLLFDVRSFLQIAGWGQIVMGVGLILGLLTRLQAVVAVMMGLVTIVVPGLIVMRDVPHFAYAFAFTGGALVMLLEGGGPISLDSWLRNRRPGRLSGRAVKAAPAA